MVGNPVKIINESSYYNSMVRLCNSIFPSLDYTENYEQ